MILRSRARIERGMLLAALALLPIVVLRAESMAESDTFWEARSGLEILAHSAIPRVDSFSWTTAGAPWTLNSWGFDVVLGIAFRAAGLIGVALIGLILGWVAIWLVLILARPAAPVMTGLLGFVLSPILIEWLAARPQLIDYVGMLALVLLTERLLAAPSAWRVGAIGALMLLWTNLHAGSLLGLGVLAVLLVALLVVPLVAPLVVPLVAPLVVPLVAPLVVPLVAPAVRRPLPSGRPSRALWMSSINDRPGWPAAGPSPARRMPRIHDRAVWLLLTIAVSAGAVLLNPYGFGIVRQALQVRGASTGLVAEWAPLDLTNPLQVIGFAAGLIALVAALRQRRVVVVAGLLCSLVGCMEAVRILPIVVLLSIPPLAAALSATPILRYVRSRAAVFVPTMATVAGILAVVAVARIGDFGAPVPTIYPERLVAAIPRSCTLFNSYDVGGYVILERPDVRVSLDSRNDLYGERLVRSEAAALAGHGSLPQLHGAGCALIPADSGLARRLTASTHWRLLHRSATMVLFQRA